MEKIVRKWLKFDIFQIQTFELNKNLTNQKKTCPETNGCTSWLGCLCNSRAELLEFGQDIDNAREILFGIIQKL